MRKPRIITSGSITKAKPVHAWIVKKPNSSFRNIIQPVNSLSKNGNHPKSKSSLCFWLVALSACWALCILQVRNRIHLYMSEPVATSVKLEHRWETKFPRITLCGSLSGFTQDIIKLLKVEAQRYNKTGYCVSDGITYLSLFRYRDINVTYVWKLANVSKDMDTAYFRFKNTIGRDAKFIHDFPTTLFGTCVTYWSPDDVKIAGDYGQLVIGTPSKGLPFQPCGTYDMCGVPCVSILAHSDAYSPYHWPMVVSGMHFSFGTYAKVLVTVRKFMYINTTSNPCWNQSLHFKCLYDCMQRMLDTVMQCRLPFMNDSKRPFCSGFLNVSWSLKRAKDLFQNPRQGACKCLRPCELDTFNMHPIIYALNQKNLKLRFALADSIIEVISENLAYDISSLLSDIGGNIGLYVGICLLTLLQLMETAILRILQIFHKS